MGYRWRAQDSWRLFYFLPPIFLPSIYLTHRRRGLTVPTLRGFALCFWLLAVRQRFFGFFIGGAGWKHRLPNTG